MVTLLSDVKIGFGNKNIYKLSWDEFEKFGKIISKDIMDNYKNLEKICLLGSARGALPLLSLVSHYTGIRNISIIQVQMTKSDIPFDYGEVSILLKAIRDDFQDFILLEDIVFKGKSINSILKELKNKTILDIYSLVVDQNFHNDNICLKSVAVIKKDKWVNFPWEKER